MTAASAASRRVVLDSSVIFSRVLHELFGRLALETGLFDLVWSDELLAECKRVLIERKPVSEMVAERWVGYLRDAFPAGRIEISELPGAVDLGATTSDPDDEHVSALAIVAAPCTLITLDAGFNAAVLAKLEVHVATPDELLVASFDEQPRRADGDPSTSGTSLERPPTRRPLRRARARRRARPRRPRPCRCERLALAATSR